MDHAQSGRILLRTIGRDVGITEISWRSQFHCDERQVADYRIGRVFLAGATLRYPQGHHEHRLVGTQATEIPLTEGRLTELQRIPGFISSESAALHRWTPASSRPNAPTLDRRCWCARRIPRLDRFDARPDDA